LKTGISSSIIGLHGIGSATIAKYPIGVMPAERVSVPEPSSLSTRYDRDIHPGARPGLRLALILVASFMVVLDFTIVNIALPSIEREFGISTSAAQWVVTGYAIAFSGLLILCGRTADLLGRRRMFIIGLVVFSLASLAGGLAGDPVLLVASRVVQGAGAAMVAPAALSLITTSFPAGPQRTRAIGLYGSIASVGFVAARCSAGCLPSGRAGVLCSSSTCPSGWPPPCWHRG
jgi:MFS family permease